MKRKRILVGVACCLAIFVLIAGPSDLCAEEIFITIGSGDISGVYFPVGLTMARMLNEKRSAQGIRAVVAAAEECNSPAILQMLQPGRDQFDVVGLDAGQAEDGAAPHEQSGQEAAELQPEEDARRALAVRTVDNWSQIRWLTEGKICLRNLRNQS